MYQCGYQTGEEFSSTRSNWTNNGPRPLKWSAWYPATDIEGRKTAKDFFDLEGAGLNAPIAEGRFPLVILSHGTGGSAEGQAWLATFLAKHGFIVIGANHHGNSTMDTYTPEGFLCWWERAEDFTELLNFHLAVGPFHQSIIADRISAAGYSLGGYTAMCLAGGITQMDDFLAWRGPDGPRATGPSEFQDAEDNIPEMIQTSPAFRTSWEGQSRDFTDGRIKSLVLLAPAPPVQAFEGATIEQIDLPILIISAGGDTAAPKKDGGDFLVGVKPDCKHVDIGCHADHYTFLSLPTRKDLIERVHIFHDHATVDRQQIHAQMCALVLPALA